MRSRARARWRETALFDIAINDARQVALVRFWGELSERDLAGLDAIGALKEADKPFDCIFDMSAVEKVDLATEFISKRGSCRKSTRTGTGSMWYLRTI